MISEKQEGLTILNWLGQWMKSGINPPNEAVCNFSFALLGAMSRIFCNGRSLRFYLEKCFFILQGKDIKIPQCYLRIDVAHIIKIFCRFKCLTGNNNKRLKQFYVRGFRLLLISSHIEEFKSILTSLLTIMLSETDGSTHNNYKTPAEVSRHRILDMIKGIKVNDEHDNGFDEDSDEIDMYTVTETEDTSNEITEFLKNIELTCRNNANIEGNSISAYYLPDLVPKLLRL